MLGCLKHLFEFARRTGDASNALGRSGSYLRWRRSQLYPSLFDCAAEAGGIIDSRRFYGVPASRQNNYDRHRTGHLRRTSQSKPGCTPAYCAYEVVESNWVLAALHWTPYSELRSEIWFRDGILGASILDFTSTANPRHSIVAHVFIQEGEGLEFDLHPWETSSPADTNGIVDVSPKSLLAHENAVLGFDTRCLTSHRGCVSVAELLPTVWEQASDGSIRCRLPNHKGLIEGPKWLWDAL